MNLLWPVTVQIIRPIVGKDHNHTTTGSLKTIDNSKLVKISLKVQKYHKNKTADYRKAEVKVITEESCVFNLGVMNMVLPHRYFLIFVC